MAPATPVILTVYVPVARLPVLFNVTVVLLPGVNGLVLKLTVVPAGFKLADKLIAVLKDANEADFKVAMALEPHTETGAGLLNENVAVGEFNILKLTLEIS